MTRNPKADRLKILGLTQAQFKARLDEVAAYLTANDTLEEIPEAQIRAALSQPVSDRVWNELKRDSGLL